MLVQWLLGTAPFERVVAVQFLRWRLAIDSYEPALFGSANLVTRVESFKNEFGFGQSHALRGVRKPIQQGRNTDQLREGDLDRVCFGETNISAGLKELNDGFEIRRRVDLTKRHEECLLDQIARDGFSAFQFTLVFQLNLSGNRRYGGVNIDGSCHGRGVSREDRPAFGITDNVFKA